MTLKRAALSGLVAVAFATVSFAAATSLGGLTSDQLGVGSAIVGACDSDGVSASYTTVDGDVTEVNLDGIAPECAGGALSLTLADDTGASIATGGPITVDDVTELVDVSPQPAAEDVAALHVVVVGP